MADPSRAEITRILLELNGEDADPALSDRLLEAVYPELRRLASSLMRRERAGHTLQPTALVHEAYLKLMGGDIDWENRAHFLGVCARAMRQILVDHARRRAAAKRGGGVDRVTLDEALGDAGRECRILELHDAMNRFADHDPRAARVVELRLFGGLTVAETAHVLGVSPRTVDGDWAVARMWLSRELAGDAPA
jgi:RNA polymerase sigma factor (TIGR02999 family)